MAKGLNKWAREPHDSADLSEVSDATPTPAEFGALFHGQILSSSTEAAVQFTRNKRCRGKESKWDTQLDSLEDKLVLALEKIEYLLARSTPLVPYLEDPAAKPPAHQQQEEMFREELESIYHYLASVLGTFTLAFHYRLLGKEIAELGNITLNDMETLRKKYFSIAPIFRQLLPAELAAALRYYEQKLRKVTQ